jgi:CRP-like cAMP-binding protein
MSILSPRQVFGEEELLDANNLKKRVYSAVCTTERVHLLEIPREGFITVMQSYITSSTGETIQKY